MKNNFQSNGKGRSQRVWQLLISMLFILTMGIGQMWGATDAPTGVRNQSSLTYAATDTLHRGGKIYEIFWCNPTSGDIKTKLVKKTHNSTNYEAAGSDKFCVVGSSVASTTASATANTIDEFTWTASSSPRYWRIRRDGIANYQIVLVVKGYDGVAALHKANADLLIKVERYNTATSSYVAYSPKTTSVSSAVSSHYKTYASLDAADQFRITFYGSGTSGTSNRDMLAFSLSVPTYTVTLNPNEGSYASTPSGWTESAGKYTKTVLAGALTIPEPTRVSYSFTGWKSGETAITLTDSKLTVAKDTTLVAQWSSGSTSTHSVTYNLGTGTGTTPTQADVAEGAKFTLHDGTTDITAPDGKQFVGWNDGTTTYAGGAEYTMSTSDVTLTAQWCTSPRTPAFATEDPITVTHNSATATWDVMGSDASIANYQVSVVKTDDASVVLDWTTVGFAAPAPSYTATDLNPKTEYTFKIRSVGVDGYCGYSPVVTRNFTTSAAPCPTKGEVFSVVYDSAKKPSSETTIPGNSRIDMITYATVTNGAAYLGNTGGSGNAKITTSKFKLGGSQAYAKAELDCALKEGDTIRIDNSTTIKLSLDTAKTEAITVSLASGKHDYIVPAAGKDLSTIFVWHNGSNVEFSYVKVIRPAKYDVTFNMHGHGTQVEPQNILEGGKVTEPATTDITGWDFGGWYKEAACTNAWDFDNDKVSADTVLHAKWTEHVLSDDATLSSLTVNGQAITLEDGKFDYAFELPMGTTALPTIAAVPNDSHSKGVSVVQTNISTATITVTAEDDSFKDYTINFTVATSKDIELVWDKTKKRCDDTNPDANVKSDDASVSAYINKITFTGGGAEGSSLNVGNTTGNMFTLSAKAGYAFQAMSFFGKIQDATCEYSLDGGAWTELASTKTDGDKCYTNIFSAAEVHEFRLRSTGTSGVWIRNMQLTMIEACTPIVVAWDEEPVEFEVGKAGYAIAATANNSGAVTYSSTDGDVIAVNGSTGALTVSALGSVTLKAATAEGDGTAYCANGGEDIVINKVVNTYYLVSFDAQNGEAADEVKYFSGDAAIALPAAPSYPGYDFQGWFDAETGGNKYLAAITPTASMTVYAQWQAQCDGATITTQPTGASYLTGRTATALICEATAGNGGALTYEWFTCDDELKTNPVAATATPSTAVAGTYYYFCKVTEEGCAVEAFSNVVTITVADKDMICIIKSIPTSGTEATVDGVYQGNAYFKGRAVDKKLNSQYDYVGVELASGYTFLATDKVVLNQTAALGTGDLSKFYVYVEEPAGGKAYATVLNASPVQGDNWFAMPTENVGQSTLYVGRVDANCNPSVGYLAVYRACAPILSKITVNSVEGTPDNTNHVTIEVPASTTQTQLEAIAYEWVSNSDAWTAAHVPVAANAWEFGVENTVTFTDKDGDASEYYITVNKAAASSDATLSALTVNGQAVALVDGVYAYDVELPYGTTAVPTVVATAHHAGAVATVDLCTLSGATITVVPESGAGDQQIYTLTFTVAAWKEIVIWDGSYMTAVATSPTAETELRWATTDFGSIDSYTTTCGEKSYSKYLPSGGASTGRYMTLTVPAGYVAKFYIVMATHSDTKERGMFIGSNLVKNPDETSVLELSNNDRDVAVAGMSEIVGAGTWYINPNASIDFQEIRAYLRKGYKRTVSNNIGTLCVDHNVAAADLFGATFYQIAGTEPQYGKIVFDEVTELVAGEPYVFQSTTGSILMFYGETVAADPVAVNGMIGSFVDFDLPITEANKADIMYIANNRLWNCEDLSKLEVVANRCYIDYSQVQPVSSPNPAPGRRRIGISGAPQVATGNENINAGETPVKVMIDGQMYILRGEKMYDATGRLVK